MDYKVIAEQIFLTAVKSVLPDQLIRKQVNIQDSTLHISAHRFSLHEIDNIFVIGAGKASALMAKEIEDILGGRITVGHVVVKYGHGCELKRVVVSEAGHPLPDNNGLLATQKIIEIASRAGARDLVICLLSGGGSALLNDLPTGGTLEDIIKVNELLLRSGADITEMNAVRKHLSQVKGGQLARIAFPATLVSLILSDVLGDPLDTIASGPTVPDSSSFEQAYQVLEKYRLLEKVAPYLVSYLMKGIKGAYQETPKIGDSIFNNTYNVIIGNNKMALEAAHQKAVEFGLTPFIITTEMRGDTLVAAHRQFETAVGFRQQNVQTKPCCLLFGGETTLQIMGTGLGGRNQHMALYFLSLLKTLEGITFLSAGTDGTDGPTDAAGTVVDFTTFDRASAMGLEINHYLKNFDSYHFFKMVGGHIISGPTMTNVMDLVIVIIE